ncbi:MAG: response regulator [Candidatus Marinimicrobia bacterium]|nr:response regulator [Candidatus Neomarinimicrobiota bacterium]MCF7850364.1 response regulator [Candidatus Neomarinimicrobiota bacterium]MCF7904489.1 response regulator [Candidatus Neomarinimicrobiota bacterium]
MKRIAVVEDNPDNLLLIQAILGKDYDLSTYEDGPIALEGLAKSSVDLMLIDIALPGMDGVELLGKLRKMDHLKQAPAIALTAHAMVGDKEKYLKAGFDGYYSKPILNFDEFNTLIRSLLDG